MFTCFSKEKFSNQTITEWFYQIIHGINYLQKRKWIHIDIQGTSILCDESLELMANYKLISIDSRNPISSYKCYIYKRYTYFRQEAIL